MPVDFDGSADFIDFDDNAIYDGLPLKSIFLRTTIDGLGDTDTPALLWKTGAADAKGWSVRWDEVNERFTYIMTTDTPGLGLWHTTNSSVVSGSTHTIGISHDITNINNDPILYLDGVADTTEDTTPADNFDTSDTEGLQVGWAGGNADSAWYNGKISDIHIANVIWTPAEFASLHASNAPGLWMRGLIFYAPMNGAAGLTEFDGAALGAANKVIDIVSGILGTPTSNPLGVADTVLAV